jgi:hypothetical protein
LVEGCRVVRLRLRLNKGFRAKSRPTRVRLSNHPPRRLLKRRLVSNPI